MPSASGLLARRAELHQQLVAPRRLLAQFAQPPPAHGALLEHPRPAAREHVHLAVVRQQLHLYGITHLAPRQRQERLLQSRQPALRRADQVAHRRIALAHRLQRLFGRDAAVHDPHPLRATVAALDGGEELRQRRLLARVARHCLVGQREPLRRHHQADHHLHAVRALVAAVAKLPQTLQRRVALEVGAGQVVQQHVEAGVEQRLPALAQEAEELPTVRQQLVQTAVQHVVRQSLRCAWQIRQRTVPVPVSVQPPLAARID